MNKRSTCPLPARFQQSKMWSAQCLPTKIGVSTSVVLSNLKPIKCSLYKSNEPGPESGNVSLRRIWDLETTGFVPSSQNFFEVIKTYSGLNNCSSEVNRKSPMDVQLRTKYNIYVRAIVTLSLIVNFHATLKYLWYGVINKNDGGKR